MHASLPARSWQQLSGSSLKLLAVLSMTADHVSLHLLQYDARFTEPLFTCHHYPVSLFLLLRCAGRLAFPLFAFLVTEGFTHTRSRRRYGLSLLLLALLSVVPWSLVHESQWLMLKSQNVMFTLLLGFLALCAVERWERGRLTAVQLSLLLLTVVASATALRSDYGACGVTFILCLYVLRQHRVLQAAVGFGLLPMKWLSAPAFIPMNMYNGRRGFIRGTVSKYAFYAYYPFHLLVLYHLRCYTMTA